jgi:hypothetical protein
MLWLDRGDLSCHDRADERMVRGPFPLLGKDCGDGIEVERGNERVLGVLVQGPVGRFSLTAVRLLARIRVLPLPWVQALSQIIARVTAPSARMPIVASPNCLHNTAVTAFELPPGVVR